MNAITQFMISLIPVSIFGFFLFCTRILFSDVIYSVTLIEYLKTSMFVVSVTGLVISLVVSVGCLISILK